MRLSYRILLQLVLVFSFGARSAAAQGVIVVTTDRSTYEYGDVIQIRVTISNPTNQSFELTGSSSCQAQFRFDGFDSSEHTICTTDHIEIQFGPGSERTWTWEIVPNVHGLPTSDGEHTVVGYYPGTELADTTVMAAPRYLGGRVGVGIEQGVSEQEIAAVRDSLNADVLSSYETGDTITEIWEISGVAVDDAVERYVGDDRFRYFEALRLIHYSEVLPIEDVPESAVHPNLTAIHPNPCGGECRFAIELPATQTVRVSILDVLGRRVKVVSDGRLAEGSLHGFTFDVQGLPNGPYVLHVEGDYFSTSRLMHVVK